MQYEPQRPSFDQGKRNIRQAALLKTAEQQTSKVLRPSGQECTVRLHSAVAADEGNVSKVAAIQQLTAVADQLQMGRQDVEALSICNRSIEHLRAVSSARSDYICGPVTATNGKPVQSILRFQKV